MTDSWFPDRELQRAIDGFARSMQPIPAMPVPDAHGMVQEFGAPGFPLDTPTSAILVITKQCQLVEWSIDSLADGSVQIGLDWSAWSVPRVWQDMVGAGTAPSLSGASTNSSTDFTNWTGPFMLRRKDAIRVTVVSGSVEAITLVLYMRELHKTAIDMG